MVANNAAVSPPTATRPYDSDDRRTKKVVNGVTTGPMWSGTDELAEYDINGDTVRRFIPDGTGAMDQHLAAVTAADVVQPGVSDQVLLFTVDGLPGADSQGLRAPESLSHSRCHAEKGDGGWPSPRHGKRWKKEKN